MIHPKMLTTALLFLIGHLLPAQDKNSIIPFRLTPFNNISIPAVLNGRDTLQLMFHSAASAVSVTEDAVKKIKSLVFNGTLEGVNSWGGSDNQARLSEYNTLQIGELKFEGISIWENKYSGQETDGKMGIDLFKGKVLMVDFEQKRLMVSNSLPKNLAKYQKLKLVVEGDLMFVEARCELADSAFSNRFLLHTGYAGSILLDDQFAQAHHLGEKLEITGEKQLKDSYGNVLKTKKAILPSLKIGQAELSKVPVGFFEGAIGQQKMSIMGGDLLKRFNMVIDAKREYIYLLPNKLKKSKYTNL